MAVPRWTVQMPGDRVHVGGPDVQPPSPHQLHVQPGGHMRYVHMLNVQDALKQYQSFTGGFSPYTISLVRFCDFPGHFIGKAGIL